MLLLAERGDLGAREIGIETGLVGAEENFPGPQRSDLGDKFVIGLDVGDRRVLNLRRRHQRNVAAAE